MIELYKVNREANYHFMLLLRILMSLQNQCDFVVHGNTPVKEDIDGQDPYEVRLSYFEFSFFLHMWGGALWRLRLLYVACIYTQTLRIVVKAKKKWYEKEDTEAHLRLGSMRSGERKDCSQRNKIAPFFSVIPDQYPTYTIRQGTELKLWSSGWSFDHWPKSIKTRCSLLLSVKNLLFHPRTMKWDIDKIWSASLYHCWKMMQKIWQQRRVSLWIGSYKAYTRTGYVIGLGVTWKLTSPVLQWLSVAFPNLQRLLYPF